MRARGTPLHAGAASGEVIRLEAPVSFWGGFDAATGLVIDRTHPQVGERLSGRVVVMPGSRGSAGTPGVLADAIRRGTGPAALVVAKPDVNLATGAIVAAALYGRACPVLVVDPTTYERLDEGTTITISSDGWITT